MKHRLSCGRVLFHAFLPLAACRVNLRLEQLKGYIHPGKLMELSLDLFCLEPNKGWRGIHHLLDDFARADLVIEHIVDHTHVVVGEPHQATGGEKKGGGDKRATMLRWSANIAIIVAHLPIGKSLPGAQRLDGVPL